MFRPTRTSARRGNILIVTVLLLALFAIVGITMVYYATAQAERARILSDAQNSSVGRRDRRNARPVAAAARTPRATGCPPKPPSASPAERR